MVAFMMPGTDSIIEFGNSLSLTPWILFNGSLNFKGILVDFKAHNYLMRIITVVLSYGRSMSFNALVLGRLSVKNMYSHWIVVLDEEKHFLALRADTVDRYEDHPKSALIDTDDPRWLEPQYEEQYAVLILFKAIECTADLALGRTSLAEECSS